MYLAYTVHIWHSYLLLCVDDNTVSDYRYDLDLKGQGQLYLTLCYGWISANFSHFSSDGVNISNNDSLCYVNYQEDYRAPI